MFFTSDHGFSLGEFNLLMDKRHAYDFNTRVPLLVRGPGIQAGRSLDAMATIVDLAPTILEMAGVNGEDAARETREAHDTHDVRDAREASARGEAAPSVRAPMDGRSMLPLLLGLHAPPWREAVLIEHLFWTTNLKCVANCSFGRAELLETAGSYPDVDIWCSELGRRSNCWQTPESKPGWSPEPMCTQECYATEDVSNSFAALRERDGTLYIEGGRHGWGENAEWRELYRDRWQTSNLVDAEPVEANRMRAALHGEWIGCRGDACP